MVEMACFLLYLVLVLAVSGGIWLLYRFLTLAGNVMDSVCRILKGNNRETEEMEMGMVYEYGNMKKPVSGDTIELLSSELNSATDLSVCAVPVSYNVCINDDLVYACSCLGNAEKMYQIIRADMEGRVWEG